MVVNCEHNRVKYFCKICGGGGICEHQQYRYRCKLCCGVSICIHDSLRWRCKLCKDPRAITIKRMVYNAAISDKKKNRFDRDNHIDFQFIDTLMNKSLNCYYCSTPMQLIEFRHDLCTIERIDNSIGHVKNNCTLACLKCNYRRCSSTTVSL